MLQPEERPNLWAVRWRKETSVAGEEGRERRRWALRERQRLEQDNEGSDRAGLAAM